MDQDFKGEKPKPVKIIKIACVPQGPDMPNRTGQFFGRIQFNRQSQHISQAISIHSADGARLGFVPADMVSEVIEFVGQRDTCACKGSINAEYDHFRESFYYWGECVIEKPNV